MAPRLSILIATMGARNSMFRGLIDSLIPQIEAKDMEPGVIEVLAHWNNGEQSIGEIRQLLLESAKGEYVCFIDDDDGVPDWYCAEIIKNMGKDYIGFEVQLFHDGRLLPRVYHSIKYVRWYQDEHGYYRGITHLNPIKREIALKGKFHNNGAGEDESWSNQIAPLVKDENYIDKIMYYYHHSSVLSFFEGVGTIRKVKKREDIERSWFHYV